MTKTPAYNADWLGNQYSFSFFLSHFLSLPLSLYFSLSFFSSPQEHSALTFGNLCGAKQEKIQTIMTVCCLSPDFCWLLFVFGFLVCVCVCVCVCVSVLHGYSRMLAWSNISTETHTHTHTSVKMCIDWSESVRHSAQRKKTVDFSASAIALFVREALWIHKPPALKSSAFASRKAANASQSCSDWKRQR